MREGSAVELECGIENIPAPPAYIYWYKVGTQLIYIWSFYVQDYTKKDFNELKGTDYLSPYFSNPMS